MKIKKVLYKIIVWPLILILTIVEWLLKLLIKISTIVVGLLINALLVCIFIAICTRQWISVGILVLCMASSSLLVYIQAFCCI